MTTSLDSQPEPETKLSQPEPETKLSQPEPETKVVAAADSYQPTDAEASVIQKLGEQMKTEIPVPQLKKSKDGRSLLLDHPNQAL
jgi:hypothetical protein